MAPTPGSERFFFIHVMKTGGTTLRNQARLNFGPDEMFPRPADESSAIADLLNYVNVRKFVELPLAERQRIRFYSGHVPFAAAELTCPEALTLTVLREPVARTLSFLRHCQRDYVEHQSMSLEEIYEDPWYLPRYIENHQTKLFSMTTDETLQGQSDPKFHLGEPVSDELRQQLRDEPWLQEELARLVQQEGASVRTMLRMSERAATELVEVDDRRLALAMSNLERLAVAGVADELDQMLATMADRYGWQISPGYRFNQTRPSEVSASFRARIEADNAADVELYRHAVELAHRQQRS